MRKALESALLLLALGALTLVGFLVNDEVYGLITLSFWMLAGVAKLLAAHEEYRNSR